MIQHDLREVGIPTRLSRMAKGLRFDGRVSAALHARPRPGYKLLTLEDAIAQANSILDKKHCHD